VSAATTVTDQHKITLENKAFCEYKHFQYVHFVNINTFSTQDDITSTTKNSSGSGGPTQIDMDTWGEMICSKSYGTHSKMLADEIATLAKRLATDTIPHDYCIFWLISRPGE